MLLSSFVGVVDRSFLRRLVEVFWVVDFRGFLGEIGGSTDSGV